jgi:8-oxo-dGTP pyrophosphatase MutT (NUDIX family)
MKGTFMKSISENMYSTKVVAGTKVKIAVGVVIRDKEERILLEKRSDNGLWGLPGGKVEPGETIEETAIREVKEETGFTVKIIRLLGVYSDPSEGRIITYPDNGDVVHLIDILLEGIIISGNLTISSESQEMRFFDLNSLPSEIASPARKPLDDYIKSLIGVIR